MFIQDLQKTVERTFSPGSNQHFLARCTQFGNMLHHRFEQVHVGGRALLGKAAALVHIGMNNRPPRNLRRTEWRQVDAHTSGLSVLLDL